MESFINFTLKRKVFYLLSSNTMFFFDSLNLTLSIKKSSNLPINTQRNWKTQHQKLQQQQQQHLKSKLFLSGNTVVLLLMLWNIRVTKVGNKKNKTHKKRNGTGKTPIGTSPLPSSLSSHPPSQIPTNSATAITSNTNAMESRTELPKMTDERNALLSSIRGFDIKTLRKVEKRN